MPDQGFQVPTSVTLPAGTVSNALAIGDFTIGGFILPAAFTGTAITFQVSVDGDTFVALNDSSGAVSLTVAQGKGYALPASVMGFRWLKFVSGSSEGADRTIQVMLKY